MSKQKRKRSKSKMKKVIKPSIRLSLPPNRRHKSKKDYKRNNKVKVHEIEGD